MSALLNGNLLNGATRLQAWAWGRGRVEGLASTGAVNTVYTYVIGSAIGEAVSTSTLNRVAFLSAAEISYAEALMVSTRYAYMDARSVSEAVASIVPLRTAWFSAPAMEGGAQQSSTAVKKRYGVGSGIAVSSSELSATRISFMYGRGWPALARSNLREDDIILFSVRQVWGEGRTTSSASVRALPNTALGRGTMISDATSDMDAGSVWQTHNVTGVSTTGSSTEAISSRVRIIRIGMYAEATGIIAPTVTKGGVRRSYFFGDIAAQSQSVAINKVLRRDPGLSLTAMAQTDKATVYLKRGAKARQTAEAVTTGMPYSNNWKKVQAVSSSNATITLSIVIVTPMVPKVMTVTSDSVGVCDIATVHMTSDPLVVQANTVAINRVISWQTGTLIADALLDTRTRVDTWMRSEATASAMVDGSGIASKGVLMRAITLAEAESTGVMIRIVSVLGSTLNAQGSLMDLLFNINLDVNNRVPGNRRYIVVDSNRVYHIKGNDRRYAP